MSLDFANPYARYTPPMSTSAEDFSFTNTFDSLKGNTESDSVAGVSGSIDTLEKGDTRDGRDKKDKDGGLDYGDIMEAYERGRERVQAIISIGAIRFTEDEIDAVLEVNQDPAKKKLMQEAMAKAGYSKEQIAFADRWGVIAATIAKKEQTHQPLTPEELELKRRLETMSPEDAAVINAQNKIAVRVRDAMNSPAAAQRSASAEQIAAAYTASMQKAAPASPSAQDERMTLTDAASRDALRQTVATGNIIQDDQVASKISDAAVWEGARQAQGFSKDDTAALGDHRGEGTGGLAFLGDDPRRGPVISPAFQDATNGTETKLANAAETAAPAVTPEAKLDMMAANA